MSQPQNSLDGAKIVCVATVPFHIATQLGKQIEALLEAGMQVTLVTSPGAGLERWIGRNGLSLVRIDIRRNVSPLSDLVAIAKLISLLGKLRPQIVHSTTPKAGLVAAIASWFCRVPVRLHTFTGQPWVERGGLVRWLARASDRLIGLLNTYCYADSPSQAAFLVAEGLLSKRKIAALGEGSLAGVDTNRFSLERYSEKFRDSLRRELGITAHTVVLLYVGRITQDKGIRELLAAAQKVAQTNTDFVLLLVGPMDEEAGGHGSIERGTLEGHSWLRYLGHSNEPEKYYAIADIFCLPSYREGFGTTVIEAAAMGVPTVGTQITGLQDAVQDGITGILVPPKDSERLFQALTMLIAGSQFRLELGRRARARAQSSFSSTVINDLLLAEYSRLLGRKVGMAVRQFDAR